MDGRAVWRDAVILVAAGAALGAAHNLIGLRSRPAHGIPWIAVERPLQSLESIVSADSAIDARLKSETPGAFPGTSRSPSRGVSRASDRGKASPPASRAPAPPAPEASTPAPNPHASAPFIPESGQPMQITLSTATRLFDARAALFLDARGASEYEAGHIPGAVRLTRDEALAPDRIQALGEPSRPIVTYCDGGSCAASRELAQLLVEAGYRRVLVYAGGFPEWAAAAHPVARGSAP